MGGSHYYNASCEFFIKRAFGLNNAMHARAYKIYK